MNGSDLCNMEAISTTNVSQVTTNNRKMRIEKSKKPQPLLHFSWWYFLKSYFYRQWFLWISLFFKLIFFLKTCLVRSQTRLNPILPACHFHDIHFCHVFCQLWKYLNCSKLKHTVFGIHRIIIFLKSRLKLDTYICVVRIDVLM